MALFLWVNLVVASLKIGPSCLGLPSLRCWCWTVVKLAHDCWQIHALVRRHASGCYPTDIRGLVSYAWDHRIAYWFLLHERIVQKLITVEALVPEVLIVQRAWWLAFISSSEHSWRFSLHITFNTCGWLRLVLYKRWLFRCLGRILGPVLHLRNGSKWILIFFLYRANI